MFNLIHSNAILDNNGQFSITEYMNSQLNTSLATEISEEIRNQILQQIKEKADEASIPCKGATTESLMTVCTMCDVNFSFKIPLKENRLQRHTN